MKMLKMLALAGAMTAEIKPKESAGDFYSRILKD